MHLTHLRRVVAGMLVIGSLCAAAPARADETDALFDKGNAAYDAGKYEEALGHFAAVWKVRKTHDLAATMAQAELKLGRHAAAAEHLRYALAHFPLTGKAEMKKRMEEVFTDVRKNIATLRVKTNVKDAAIAIDGSPLDAATAREELFVSPGPRTIEVSAPGHSSVRRTIDAKAGDTQDVTFTLMAVEEPPARSMLPPAIAFGVGGAGLVMGAIGGGIAAAKFDELKRTCGEALVCPESARGTYDAANTASYFSTAGFVVAGVGAAVGVTLLLLPANKKASTRTGISLGPAFVSVKGSF